MSIHDSRERPTDSGCRDSRSRSARGSARTLRRSRTSIRLLRTLSARFLSIRACTAFRLPFGFPPAGNVQNNGLRRAHKHWLAPGEPPSGGGCISSGESPPSLGGAPFAKTAAKLLRAGRARVGAAGLSAPRKMHARPKRRPRSRLRRGGSARSGTNELGVDGQSEWVLSPDGGPSPRARACRSEWLRAASWASGAEGKEGTVTLGQLLVETDLSTHGDRSAAASDGPPGKREELLPRLRLKDQFLLGAPALPDVSQPVVGINAATARSCAADRRHRRRAPPVASRRAAAQLPSI